MLKDFYKRFNIEASIDAEKDKFMARVNVAIFQRYNNEIGGLLTPQYLEWVSVEIGEDWTRYITTGSWTNYKEIVDDSFKFETICQNKFNRYLIILQSIYNYIDKYFDNLKKSVELNYLNEQISHLLDKSTVELGVFWKKGKFYPSGSKFLDKELVMEVLDWLSDFPEEKRDFEKALKALLEKRNSDVVGECYNCVEGLVRRILNNKKVLDNNKEELITKLKLSQEWKSLVISFIKYSNEYKRHASGGRHQANPVEVEAFLYLTGLITRLCLKTSLSKDK